MLFVINTMKTDITRFVRKHLLITVRITYKLQGL